jgi:hypothetical protein
MPGSMPCARPSRSEFDRWGPVLTTFAAVAEAVRITLEVGASCSIIRDPSTYGRCEREKRENN